MRSPAFLGVPRPTGERVPAAQGKARAHSGTTALTRGEQALRAHCCSTPSGSLLYFLGVPSRDYPILWLSQPLRPLPRRGPRSVWSPLWGSLPGLCLHAAPDLDLGPERGWRPGHQRGLSVTPGRGGRGGGPRLQLSTGGGNADRRPSARRLPPLPEDSEWHGRAAWASGHWAFEGAAPGRARAPRIPHGDRLPGTPGSGFSTPEMNAVYYSLEGW